MCAHERSELVCGDSLVCKQCNQFICWCMNTGQQTLRGRFSGVPAANVGTYTRSKWARHNGVICHVLYQVGHGDVILVVQLLCKTSCALETKVFGPCQLVEEN
jgi:hypothetical protein